MNGLMASGDPVQVLRSVLDRLAGILAEPDQTPIPPGDHLAIAAAALANGGSASEGRDALRSALAAEGLSEDEISAIDARYLRSVVGGVVIPI